jgi:hypothetical protein
MILSTLQGVVVKRMLACPFFAGPPAIPVLAQDRSDILNRMQISLSKLGLVVVVGEPRVDNAGGRSTGLLGVTLPIGIYENWLVNQGPSGTKHRGIDVGMAAIPVLIGSWWETRLGFTELVFQTLEPVGADVENNWLEYALTFTTHVRLPGLPTPGSMAAPAQDVITYEADGNGGQMTMEG